MKSYIVLAILVTANLTAVMLSAEAADRSGGIRSIGGAISDIRTGQPIARATIRLEGTEHATTSDSAGSFAFFGIPENTYTLRVSKRGYKPRQTSPLVVDYATPVECQIELQKIAEPIVDSITVYGERGEIFRFGGIPPLAEPVDPRNSAWMGTITGTVTSAETGEPIVGASVLLVGTHCGANTDLDGRYCICRADTGTFTIRIRHVEFNSIEVANVVVEGGDTTVVDAEFTARSVEIGETITVHTVCWDFPLSTGPVQGVVKDAETGRPIRRAKVEIVGTDRWTSTDMYGWFVFRRVRSGLHFIRVTHDEYCPKDERIRVLEGRMTGFDVDVLHKIWCDSL